MQRFPGGRRLVWVVLVTVALAFSSAARASLDEAWAGYAEGYAEGGGTTPIYDPSGSAPHFLAGYDAGFNDAAAFKPYGTSFPYYLFAGGSAGADVWEQQTATAQLLTRGDTQRLTRSFRQLRDLKPQAAAGDFVTNVAVTASGSYAVVDDDLLKGNGHDRTTEALAALGLGERLTLGLGLSQDNYWINGNHRDYEETVNAADLILAADLTEAYSVGAFVNVSRLDIETETVFARVTPGDRFERYGAGLLASYNEAVGPRRNVGLTTALASLNKHTLGDLFDNEDSAWIVMGDVNQKLSERLAVDVWGSYFTLLDRETAPAVRTPDGTYWTWGADAEFQVSRQVKVRLGASTSAGDDERHERRVATGLTVNF